MGCGFREGGLDPALRLHGRGDFLKARLHREKSKITAGESLLVSCLQEIFGHSLRSLRFIRQLGT